MTPNILIIGGGLGGLCLAQGLKKAKIPFRIFERDTSATWRAQGYRISILPEGASALHNTLPPSLWQIFEKVAIVQNKGIAAFNATDASPVESRFQPRAKGAGPPNGAGPTANAATAPRSYIQDRTTLRTLLTFGIEDDISYDKKFEKFEITEDGVTAFFKDGSQYSGNLLVAADGAYSSVRRQLLPHNFLYDTGSRSIYGKTPLSEKFLENYNADALYKTSFGHQNERGLFALMDPARFSNDPHTVDNNLKYVDNYVYWALVARTSEFGVSDDKLIKMYGDAAADLSLRMTKEWHPSIKILFEMQDRTEAAVIRLHTSSPDVLQQQSDRCQVDADYRIMLLGDAAHAMLPTGASGANTAFRDAEKLAQLIVENHGRPSREAMELYEKEMNEYASGKVTFSIQNAGKMFGMPLFEHFTPIEH